MKSKLGLYHVVLTTPKTSPEKVTMTVVEIQYLPNIEKPKTKQEEILSKMDKINC